MPLVPIVALAALVAVTESRAEAPAPPAVMGLPASGELVLQPGVRQVVEIPGLQRWSVNLPQALEVTQFDAEHLALTVAPSAGARLVIWAAGQERAIRVFAQLALIDSPIPVDHLVFTDSTIRARVVLHDLVLDGDLGSLTDAAALEALVRQSEHVLSFVRFPPILLRAGLAEVDAHFGGSYHASWAGERVLLRNPHGALAEEAALAWVQETWAPLERLVHDGWVWIEPPLSDPRENTIALGLGTQKIIAVGAIEWFGVSDSELLEVEPTGQHNLRLFGAKAGTATLLIKSSTGRLKYRVIVADMGPWCGSCEFCKYFRRQPAEFNSSSTTTELRLRMVGDRIYLDGEILERVDLHRIVALHRLYPNLGILARISPRLRWEAAHDADDDLLRMGFTARVLSAGRFLDIEPWPTDPIELEAAQSVAHAYLESLRPYL